MTDSTQTLSEDLIQMVDENGKFIPLEDFNDKVQKWGFLDKGFDYYCVAVLGAQSSGKSTLLNLLFNTKFQTLNADEGRLQITKGIWAGVSSFTSFVIGESIIVFDVEGVDGRERGEKEASFERKTSLFSLALAEVLIINMWHTDVGRYNAGNVALLKTVFEQHTLLFGKNRRSNRTLIMFVIRDHLPEETSLEKLKTIIMKDMNGIWDTINKPAELQTTKLTDFFEFQFVGLAHKVLAPTKFMDGIATLRGRFVDPKTPDFILGKDYKTDIPADGLVPYASKIWETIMKNKDLDLPSQKEMLAMFRCEEIMAGVLKEFNQSIAPIKASLDRSYVEDFGRKITELHKRLLGMYDGPSSRYHQEVATRKRDQLVTAMNTELYNMFSKQLQKLGDRTIQFFEKLLTEAVPTNGTAMKDFAATIQTILKSTYDYYESSVNASLLEGAGWSYQAEYDALKQVLQKQVETAKENELKKLMEELRISLQSLLVKPLDKIIEAPAPDMWSTIRTLFESCKEKTIVSLQERLKGFQIEAEEAHKKVEDAQRLTFEVLKDKFKNKAKFMSYTMSKKFEEKFNLDENGLPRRWKQADDVKKMFLDARVQALIVLDQFAFLRLNPAHDSVKFVESNGENVDESLVIISGEECQQLKDKFEKESNTSYLQALRDQEHVASAAHVPMYIMILILLLGANEFLYILTNPLLLMLCVFVGIGGYVLYMLNMMGPAKAVMEALLHTSLSTLQQYVVEQMNKQQTPATNAGVATNNNNSTSERKPKSE